jgi:fused signal recognition particle receptor
MFKFLKDKLKGAISSLSGKIDPQEEEVKEEAAKEAVVEERAAEAKGFFQKIKETFTGAPEELPAEREAKERETVLAKRVDPVREVDAEEIENVIRDIDIHAPLPDEDDPEPVPAVMGAAPEPVLRSTSKNEKKNAGKKEDAGEPEIVVEEFKPPVVVTTAEEREGGQLRASKEDVPKVASKIAEERQERVAKSVTPAVKQVQDAKASKPVLARALEDRPAQPAAEQRQKQAPAPRPVQKEEGQRPELPSTIINVKPVEEAKGFFGKIAQAFTTKKVSEAEFENLFWELEVALLENNVALEVIEKIKRDLAIALVDKALPRGKVEETIGVALRQSLREVVSFETIDLLAKARTKKPFIICFVGVNGSGKTTTIAKMAHLFLDHKMSVVLAAADTFRAAAIDQLELHGKRLGVKVIRHDYGADPAAVAFDAIKHAEAKGVDVVLIDTAGRLHNNINLVDEMKKIVRVAKPDLKIFVGESITGNDCVEQAQQFDQAVGIDGIVLAKADIDEKGGAAISVGYVTRKPILYMGTGQEYADLERFEPEKVLASLGL